LSIYIDIVYLAGAQGRDPPHNGSLTAEGAKAAEKRIGDDGRKNVK